MHRWDGMGLGWGFVWHVFDETDTDAWNLLSLYSIFSSLSFLILYYSSSSLSSPLHSFNTLHIACCTLHVTGPVYWIVLLHRFLNVFIDGSHHRSALDPGIVDGVVWTDKIST
jgi:hypothetical protein